MDGACRLGGARGLDNSCWMDEVCWLGGTCRLDGGYWVDDACWLDGACGLDGACWMDDASWLDGACRLDGDCWMDGACRLDGACWLSHLRGGGRNLISNQILRTGEHHRIWGLKGLIISLHLLAISVQIELNFVSLGTNISDRCKILYSIVFG